MQMGSAVYTPKTKSNIASGFALQAYLKAEEGILHASQNNYDYWYIDGSLHSEFPEQWPQERIVALVALCEQIKILPIYHGNFKAPLASDVEFLRQAAVEYVKKEIDICANFPCPLILHGGALVEPRTIREAKERGLRALITSLKELQAYAKERNVLLLLENLSNYPNYRPFHYIATKVEEFEMIFSEAEVSMFFDFGHANVNAEIPVEDFFKRCASRVAAVSMSNNNGNLDQHLKLHDGNINYADVLSLMKQLQWQGIVCFEVRNMNPKKVIESFSGMEQLAVES